MTQIRAKSIVVLQHLEKFLFTACFEATNNQVFYIPVGGGVEPGEYSADAARREVLEETGQKIEELQLLAVDENIFTYNGKFEHEIVFIYRAVFANKQAYGVPLTGNLDDNGIPINLVWATLDEIKSKDIRLYPAGLEKALTRL
jgi:ADP-ribose pyrophosphatase YjhB (NUDIX family)